MSPYIPDQVLLKIDTGPDCWEWTGAKKGTGYGNLAWKGRGALAHRVVYELTVGPVPPGLHIDHLCRNRGCVNPDHLEPVAPGVNVMRGTGVGPTNAAKTRCVNGHPFDEANTRFRAKGHRICRACQAERSRRRRRLRASRNVRTD